MKASMYNYIIDLQNGDKAVYNCMTSAIVKMDSKVYSVYLRVASGSFEKCVGSDDSAIIEDLRCGGYIIEDDFNELDLLRVKVYNRRFRNRNLSLVIAPTMDCNFDCVYCYEEKEKKIYMSQETEKSIVDYVDEFTSANKKSELFITWFGGEPTMALDIIYRLSGNIIEIVRKNEVAFGATMITNGYLLDGKTALELKKHGVLSVTISVDGTAEKHDRQRPLKDGTGTFETIIKNIKEIIGILDVMLMVNISNDNDDNFQLLLDELENAGILKHITVGVKRLLANTGACQSVAESVLDLKSFAQTHVKLYKQMIDRNIHQDIIPTTDTAGCKAYCKNDFLIHPSGELYKCWNTIGQKNECVGNINELSGINYNYAKWLSYDPFENKMCRKCRVFPICLGYCAHNWIGSKVYEKTSDKCSEWKFNLAEFIKLKLNVREE